MQQRSIQLAGGTLLGDLDAADGWEAMRQTTEALCDILEHLDAHFLVVLDEMYSDHHTGAFVGPRHLDQSGWQRLVTTVHQIGEYTARRRITAVFHPHADTTIQFEPQIEQFLALTDPSLVKLCLDAGHHAYPGGDPAAFFRRHHDRIPYVHLKDVDQVLRSRARDEGWPVSRAAAEGTFVDLGQGCADILGLHRAAEELGYRGWGIVEQDMYPTPFDKPLPIAKRNREFLQRNGIG